MHIEINLGEGVQHSETLDGFIHRKLGPVERRFGDRLTRVEVFFKDVNAGKGGIDKACTMEARPAGIDPVAVEAQDEDPYKAAKQAADKLDRALEHRTARAAKRG